MAQEHWYACETPPMKERAACELLQRKGYATWLPTYSKRVKVGRAPVRYENRDKPFIPSLVFCNPGVDIADNVNVWHSLASCRLVRSIVGMGGVPRVITSEQIDRMAETRGQLHALEMARAEAARVKTNAAVVVTAGSMAGLQGTVKELHGHRAKVLLQFFGSTRDVEINVASLAAA